MGQIVIFSDGLLDLGPLGDLRSAADQRLSALTWAERLEFWRGSGARGMPGGDEVLLINGALCADRGVLETPLGAAYRSSTGRLGAARCRPSEVELTKGGGGASRPLPAGWRLMERPWHALDGLAGRIASEITDVCAGWKTARAACGEHPVFVAAGVSIGPGAIMDTRAGPIALAEDAAVEPNAVVQGPVWIGRASVIAPGALIRGATSIGPWCKIGGEVSGCIFTGYSNKAHDGFLGDSLVGEWVNLGAATNNSNLLNTYGEVTMRLRPSAALEKTGRQFFGCLIGDHVKTAIGTRIFTGASVGTGTMWAASAPLQGATESFEWATDEGRRQHGIEKFLETARTVMKRRAKELSAADETQLRALHAARR